MIMEISSILFPEAITYSHQQDKPGILNQYPVTLMNKILRVLQQVMIRLPGHLPGLTKWLTPMIRAGLVHGMVILGKMFLMLIRRCTFVHQIITMIDMLIISLIQQTLHEKD